MSPPTNANFGSFFHFWPHYNRATPEEVEPFVIKLNHDEYWPLSLDGNLIVNIA